MYTYQPVGVCAKKIEFEVEGNALKNLVFTNGCPGNLIGIQKLVEGMDVDEVIRRLEGITCGKKITSCPDQLVKALERWKAGTLEKSDAPKGTGVPHLKLVM
ncbi:TSCPD domain-containing protein [Desulfoluna limicola]|uniref:ribonucleoside-diphosphate reductase n=1 Tax=Desulfoluna limicola TaxID=2810562 RepID=A0ABM7PFD4_9BACT|nr:TIGR03905 family TSCPD domain-containing protein [Desulfoluna limicola]BCS96296.1 TSCPD domain-containing protein [Desulfoluna limicola]